MARFILENFTKFNLKTQTYDYHSSASKNQIIGAQIQQCKI